MDTENARSMHRRGREKFVVPVDTVVFRDVTIRVPDSVAQCFVSAAEKASAWVHHVDGVKAFRLFSSVTFIKDGKHGCGLGSNGAFFCDTEEAIKDPEMRLITMALEDACQMGAMTAGIEGEAEVCANDFGGEYTTEFFKDGRPLEKERVFVAAAKLFNSVFQRAFDEVRPSVIMMVKNVGRFFSFGSPPKASSDGSDADR